MHKLTTYTDGEAAVLRVIGMEEVWSAEAGMVFEGNAAALCIEYGRGDVAKAVQWVGPVLTCQHSHSLVFTQLHCVVNKRLLPVHTLQNSGVSMLDQHVSSM